MCAVTLDAGRQVVVPDARGDVRFARNPFVTGRLGALRFYAASPLRGPDGTAFGTLCVFDEVPRPLDDEAAHWLELLASQVVHVLEERRTGRELRRTVAELEAARRELARSNDQLTAFAGQVSHDLRTPLTAVVGFVEVLAKLPAVAGDERAREYIGLAAGAGRRMAGLLEELLAHARLGGSLRVEPVDLAELVGEVLDDLSAVLAGTGARVQVGELPRVPADRTQLRAVLQNLLGNAVAYRRPDRPLLVRVRAARSMDGWRVEVVDNGSGVPPERRVEVFEPLVRLGGSGPGHSGLGLATCRRVVSAHGGRIGLSDGEDGGTTAWFTLPEPD
jgi:signal transduction histidine kinase